MSSSKNIVRYLHQYNCWVVRCWYTSCYADQMRHYTRYVYFPYGTEYVLR